MRVSVAPVCSFIDGIGHGVSAPRGVLCLSEVRAWHLQLRVEDCLEVGDDGGRVGWCLLLPGVGLPAG